MNSVSGPGCCAPPGPCGWARSSSLRRPMRASQWATLRLSCISQARLGALLSCSLCCKHPRCVCPGANALLLPVFSLSSPPPPCAVCPVPPCPSIPPCGRCPLTFECVCRGPPLLRHPHACLLHRCAGRSVRLACEDVNIHRPLCTASLRESVDLCGLWKLIVACPGLPRDLTVGILPLRRASE